MTSLIFLYRLTKNLPNQISLNLFKMVIFYSFLAITPVWDVIETCFFVWMTLVTSLIFLYRLTNKLPNQISPNLFKMVIFYSFWAITQVWDVIETWGFCVDDPCDFPDIPISPQKKLPNQTSRNLLKMMIFRSFLAITPVWDLIEIRGFHMDLPPELTHPRRSRSKRKRHVSMKSQT